MRKCHGGAGFCHCKLRRPSFDTPPEPIGGSAPTTDRARQVEAPLEAVRSALERWVCGHPVSDGNALGFCELLVERGYRITSVTPEPAGEVARLRQIIERERTAYMRGLAAIRDELRARGWLTEGRGSYEWDDDRYREEFARAVHALVGHLDRIERETAARSFTDCPQDDATIHTARAELAEPAGERGGDLAETVLKKFRPAFEIAYGNGLLRKSWQEMEAGVLEILRHGGTVEEWITQANAALATPSAGSRDDE